MSMGTGNLKDKGRLQHYSLPGSINDTYHSSLNRFTTNTKQMPGHYSHVCKAL